MKKEKSIILSAVMLTALTVLSSCGKKESNFDKDNTSNRIDFTSFQSKGVETKETDLINFGVYAYYTKGDFDKNTSEPNFMFNTKVGRESSEHPWSYDPLMFWPNSGKLSFFAYAPYGEDEYLNLTPITTKGYPQITYTVPDNILDQRDLLISTPLYNLTKQTNTSGNVKIPFKHALSSIVFHGERVGGTAATDLTINVESAKIESLKKNAKYNYDGPSWDELSGLANYTLEKGVALKDEALNNNGDQQISNEDYLLMVIPQTIEDDIYLTVKVRLLYSHNDNPVFTETKVKLNTLIPVLEIGKKYKINIKVNLADITLGCTVVPWTDETVNVPDFD